MKSIVENSITINGITYKFITTTESTCANCDLVVECNALDGFPCAIFEFITISKGYFKKVQ
mgnify:CR=1 FL=1